MPTTKEKETMMKMAFVAEVLLDERTGTHFNEAMQEYQQIIYFDDSFRIIGAQSAQLPEGVRKEEERKVWRKFFDFPFGESDD